MGTELEEYIERICFEKAQNFIKEKVIYFQVI